MKKNVFDLEATTRIILDTALERGFFDFRLTVCGKGIEGVTETQCGDVELTIMPDRIPRHLYPIISDSVTVTFRNRGLKCSFSFDESCDNFVALFDECFNAFVRTIATGDDEGLVITKE